MLSPSLMMLKPRDSVVSVMNPFSLAEAAAGTEIDMETTSSTSADAPHPPPDGGIIAWTQVLVAHLVVFNGFGYAMSFSLFEAHYAATLNSSASAIAWVGSTQLFLQGFMGVFSGRALDAGYLRYLVALGCLLQILGVFSTSVAKAYWQLFLAQGIAQGMGNGLIYTAVIALISTYFCKKKLLAVGLVALGVPGGGVVFPVIARQLITKIGFAWTVRVMGFVMTFNFSIVAALVRSRLIPKQGNALIDLSAFREPVYSLFVVGIVLVQLGLYTASYYLAVYGKEVLHVSTPTSLTMVIAMNGVGYPGRIIAMAIAIGCRGAHGAFTALLPCVLAAGVVLFGWIWVTDLRGLIAFSVVYGFWSNAVQILFPMAFTALVTDLSSVGTRLGMCFTLVGIACLVGPPISGALINVHAKNGFLGAQIFGATTILVGGAFLVAAWIVNRKRDTKKEK